MPSYKTFCDTIQTKFDFELVQIIDPQITKICAAGHQAQLAIEQMKRFVCSIKNFNTRKQQAEHINITYGKLDRSAFVFTLLDNKHLSKPQLLKIINQCLLQINCQQS